MYRGRVLAGIGNVRSVCLRREIVADCPWTCLSSAIAMADSSDDDDDSQLAAARARGWKSRAADGGRGRCCACGCLLERVRQVAQADPARAGVAQRSLSLQLTDYDPSADAQYDLWMLLEPKEAEGE